MYISKIFYMNDSPKYRWGYVESEEDMQLASKVGIIAIQEDGETREDFLIELMIDQLSINMVVNNTMTRKYVITIILK